MSTDATHAKKASAKMTAKEKKQAQMTANRRAQLQWYVVAAVLTIAVIAAIVLIAIYTDGSVGGHG